MTGYADRLLSGGMTQVDDAQQAGGYASRLLGDAQPAPRQPSAKPQGGNIFSNAWEMIKGKQDPRFKDVPGFDIDRAGADVVLSTAGASLSGANDAAYADIIQKSLGDRFKGRTKDAHGYDIIDYVDAKGARRQGYVNQPGLDINDIQRGVGGAFAYLGAGRALAAAKAMKGAPLLGRVTAQGGGAASTSIVQDIVSMMLGSEQGIDQKKAMIAGAGGALFEGLPSKAIAPLLGAGVGAAVSNQGEGLEGAGLGAMVGMSAAALARRFLGMNPGQYVQNGKLTPAGEAAATKAGINPADVDTEFAKVFAESYAKTRNAATASVDASSRSGPGAVRLTKGQREKDFEQMVLEDQMRAGIKGQQAKTVMDDFDRLQQRDVEWAVRGSPTELSGVGPRLNQSWEGRSTQELGDSIRGGVQAARNSAKDAERTAWGDVKPFQAPDEALAMLPGTVKQELGQLGIPVNQNTPAASKMLDFLRDYRTGKAPAGADDFVPDMVGHNVDQVRRILRSMKDDAATATDKAATDAVYRSYNTWIQKASDAGHFPAEVAGAMRGSRQLTAEVRGLFEPRDGGRMTPAAERIRDIIQRADSPEGVVSTLFGRVGAKSEMPGGTVQVLSNLKTALQRYAPETGKQTWDDIRLAYWQRITSDGAGNLASPQAIAKNIATAKEKHGGAWNVLLSPSEQKMILQVQKAVESAAYRPSNFRTNSSGSAFAGGSMVKDLISNVWKAMVASPVVSATAGVAARPVAAGWYKAKANRAVDQRIREVVPSLGGYGGAAGSAAERGRK